MIDSRDLEYPDREYRVDNLEMPEPILSSDGTKVKFSKGDNSPDGLLKTSSDKSSKLCTPPTPPPPSLSLSLSHLHPCFYLPSFILSSPFLMQLFTTLMMMEMFIFLT